MIRSPTPPGSQASLRAIDVVCNKERRAPKKIGGNECLEGRPVQKWPEGASNDERNGGPARRDDGKRRQIKSNSSVYQLFLHTQHRLRYPDRARFECGAVGQHGWPAPWPPLPHTSIATLVEKGRPRATARRPGARRCTRRRASTTLFLAATHISTCRVSSVDAVCDQHDDQEPHMATERRPFGGRSCSWSLAWRGGRSGRRSATRARPSSKCVPARSRYGHVVGR